MQRIALLGAGFIGSVHAANLFTHPDVELVSVFDVARERAAALAQRYQTVVAESIQDAFDPNGVDAVLIATSTDTHTEHLQRAAEAGIAAFVEKPIDLDLARATAAVAAVERTGIPVMVDFNRRFDRDHAELRRVVQAGEIGSLELLQLISRGPVSPPLEYVAVSGGQMRDQTVHFFDLARWIAGADPVEVVAIGSALADPRIRAYDDVDTSVAVLRFEDGTIAQLESVRRTGYGYDERIEAMGAEGLVESGHHATGAVTVRTGQHAVSAGLHPGWFERVQPTYRASRDGFVSALENGTPMPVTLRDALKAQAIAEAATASLASGKTERILYPA